MSVEIRRATVRDAAGIAAVLNGVIAEGRLTLFDQPFSLAAEEAFMAALSPRSALHIADLEGTIVGVQSIDQFSTMTASTSHVATMGTWMHSAARGKGFGRRLAAESFRFATRHDYTKIVVQVLASNDRALRFYRGLGFITIGRARQHVKLAGVFHDEIYLEKQL